MKKQIILSLAALLAFAPLGAQTTQKLSAGKGSDYGLVYSLPTTALDIYVEARLTKEVPGEYYNYAKRHLGITDAITEESNRAEIVKVTVVPRGVANTQQQWLAKFKKGNDVTMTLNDAGVPMSINAEAAPLDPVSIETGNESTLSPLEGDAARQAVTQDMARSASVSKRAELAAQRIFELRQIRSDLLAGQSENPPADGAAMKLVLDNLGAQEAALTAMFAGSRTTTRSVQRFSFVPDANETTGFVIARLSSVDGLIPADNLAGAPITIDVHMVQQASMPQNDKGETQSFPKGGVAYNIPGTARVNINFNGQTVSSTEMPMAQFGTVFGLDPSIFYDKKEPYGVIFDTTTGGIIELAPLRTLKK